LLYYNRRDEIQKTKKEMEKLELRKSNLQNDLMDRKITSQDYQDMKGRGRERKSVSV
jgi:butyrate kinase